MTRRTRRTLIKKIEDEREGSFLITYITNTRPGGEIRMAMDSIRHFYNHIQKITDPENTRIDLMIHSNGGDGTVPWRLVNLLREHCNEFNVLVPCNAFSAATLTALGADKIMMHPMGILGPTDPIVGNIFNPKDPDTKQQMGISVEDVSAYIELIKEDVGITHEDELVIAFNHLANKVHPLALGNTKRSRSQSKQLAQKLLEIHLDPKKEAQKISEIVERLTSKSYYHGHPINRKEAKEIGLHVEDPNQELEKMMWKLFCEYEKEMILDKPFNFIHDFIAAFPNLQTNQQQTLNLPLMKGAYIESKYYSDVFTVQNQVIGVRLQNGIYNVNLGTLSEAWVRE